MDSESGRWCWSWRFMYSQVCMAGKRQILCKAIIFVHWAAITNRILQTEWFINWVISHSSEAWKSKIKVSTHSFPGNISLPGFQMPPSPVLMWWREHTGLSSSSYKVLIPPRDSYFMTSSKPHYFPKALPPNITLEGKTSMHEFRRGYGLVLTCSHHPRLRTYLCLELSGIPANFLWITRDVVIDVVSILSGIM